MMGTLHGAERVPLWKEEMIERVKRRSAIKKEREAMASSAAATSRQVLRVSGRHGATAAADSLGGAARGGGTRGGANAEEVNTLERKVYWYSDAIHEQARADPPPPDPPPAPLLIPPPYPVAGAAVSAARPKAPRSQRFAARLTAEGVACGRRRRDGGCGRPAAREDDP